MSQLKKIVKIIVNFFTCVLLVILALVIYGKIILTFTDKGYPNYFGYTFFEVASGSMKPVLQINDVILVKIGKDNLKEGDIIAFKNEGAIITHRILFIDGNILTVKGDSNNVVDKPITYEQVIGPVVKIFPELGIWKKVITEPKILFSIFVTFLLFDFALSYNGKPDMKKEKKKEVLKDTVDISEIAKKVEVSDTKDDDKKEVKTSKPKKIESEELLELTRKIDIDEINKLLEGTEYKLEKKEINSIKKEVSKMEEVKDVKKVTPNLTEKTRKALEYTMRLDLSSIQKKINKKIK